METKLVRTTETLKTLLLPNVDCDVQAKVWETFSPVEQEAIRQRYHIYYLAAVHLSKAGDDAAEAGSLLEWAGLLEESAATVHALAKLGLEIGHAEVTMIALTGPVEKLEEAARTGIAYRIFHLDEATA